MFAVGIYGVQITQDEQLNTVNPRLSESEEGRPHSDKPNIRIIQIYDFLPKKCTFLGKKL